MDKKFEISRSAFDTRTAMDFAGQQENPDIIKVLTSEFFDVTAREKKKRKPPPPPIISATDTGM